MNKFESHWVPHSNGLVPHLSKKLSKLLLAQKYLNEYTLTERRQTFEIKFSCLLESTCSFSLNELTVTLYKVLTIKNILVYLMFFFDIVIH